MHAALLEAEEHADVRVVTKGAWTHLLRINWCLDTLVCIQAAYKTPCHYVHKVASALRTLRRRVAARAVCGLGLNSMPAAALRNALTPR